MERRDILLTTDCEGPLALNDNAFELCREFMRPDGDRFFKQVSRYDDYLADVAKKPGYLAGDTLKLILPFLKAHGVTGEQILKFSEKTASFTPGADTAYRFLHTLGFPIFMISASYRQFAEAVGKRLGFDPANILATDLDLDHYRLREGEGEELSRLKQEIVAAPEIELPPGAGSLEELPGPAQEAIGLLDKIFGEIIPGMEIGRIYQEVRIVGGPDKARALAESLEKTGRAMSEAIYVGDSITDVAAFETVRTGGGLGISFNGNRYAVRAAQFIVIADNAWPMALLTVVFQNWGVEGVTELATAGRAAQERICALPEATIEPIMQGLQGRNFFLYPANAPGLERIAQQSADMRIKLRGEAIAELG